MSATFDLRTMILVIIGSGILVAILVLTGVVICLYVKLSKALKDGKKCDLEANSANTKDMVFQAETAAADSYPNLEFCDECKMYADYDPLPPCFCDAYEGL